MMADGTALHALPVAGRLRTHWTVVAAVELDRFGIGLRRWSAVEAKHAKELSFRRRDDQRVDRSPLHAS